MANITPQAVASAKDKAEDLFEKGRLREAFDTYDHVKAYGEKDPRILIRMGDIARKLENIDVAIESYKLAIKAFVKQGFLIKAIAVCKLAASLDPSREDIQKILTELAPTSPGPTGAAPAAGAAQAQPKAAMPAPKTPSPAAKAAVEDKPALPKIPLFSDFNEEEFHAVVSIVKAREIAADEYLFREGDTGDSLFFISEGEVEVTGRVKDGRDISFARLKEGDVFGEFGFFSDAKRLTGIKAKTRASLLELTKKDLDVIINQHKRVGDILINFYKERVVDRLMALSDVFEPLSEQDRKEILKRLSIVGYNKGSVITKEGEPGDTMYLIKSGTVSVSVKNKAGKDEKLAEMKEGDFFGEIALATNRPRMATITALTNVSLVEFSRPLIKDVLGKYPSIKTILERVIKERATTVMTAREKGVLT